MGLGTLPKTILFVVKTVCLQMIALHFICFAQQSHLLLNQLVQYSLEICSERVAGYGKNSRVRTYDQTNPL